MKIYTYDSEKIKNDIVEHISETNRNNLMGTDKIMAEIAETKEKNISDNVKIMAEIANMKAEMTKVNNSTAQTASYSIYVENKIVFTLLVTILQNNIEVEEGVVLPNKTEKYRLEEDWISARVTIKDKAKPEIGWVKGRSLEKGETYTVEGPPGLRFN